MSKKVYLRPWHFSERW